jgi:hypothetical protein
MDEQKLINRLWAKFSTDNEDLTKVEEIVGTAARQILEEAAANGVDAIGFIEADEDGFLSEVSRRTRERCDELGVRNVQRKSDWSALYEQTKAAVAK